MSSDCISYQDSGYFSDLISDYLNRETSVSNLYHRYPEISQFRYQIDEKAAFFTPEKRQVLVQSLRRQYENTDATLATLNHLESLSKSNTFTVTTGHQLNLFTGPLYFLYKIVSVINLAKELESVYPDSNFVPVYWMATEDHDFEEISYFNFRGKKFRWNREAGGAVGKLSTDGLDDVLRLFETELGPSENAKKIAALFREAYLEHTNLTDATRWLANKLFGDYGLVIIDGDDCDLKREFIPYMREDIKKNTAFAKVNETISKMENYTVQVNPREINLFYLADGLRERIVAEADGFRIFGTNQFFSKSELMDELAAYPQRFSPNVIMRPLYQEVILPNLSYTGGGGEIAYWLELKSFFESQFVPMPILMVRNSVVMASEKQQKKRQALDLSWRDLFAKTFDLENTIASKLSEFPTNLDAQRDVLEKQFDYLTSLIDKTDASFSGAVKAQKTHQLKGLDNLEKRLMKAQRRKFSDQISRATELQQELFKNGGLQERQANFSEVHMEMGENLIPKLLEELHPFSQAFSVITY